MCDGFSSDLWRQKATPLPATPAQGQAQEKAAPTAVPGEPPGKRHKAPLHLKKRMKVERNQRDRPAPPVPGASLPGPASGAAPGADSAAKYYPCINESLTPRGVYCSREQS